MIAGKEKRTWGVKTGTIYMAFSYSLTALFIFGFQLIAVRLLKPNQYGLISVLYSSVVFVSLFLGQTFELTLSKYVSEYEANGQNYFLLIKHTWIWQLSSMIIFIVLSMIFKTIIVRSLFPEVPYFYYIFLACGIFYSMEIGFRGVMRGLREFGYFGTLTITLNLFRIIYLVLFVGVFELGLFGAAISILIASLTNLLITFFWYRGVWSKLKGHGQIFQTTYGFWNLGKFILPTMAMFGLGAYFNNTGPLFIKLLGGESSNEIAGLFLIAVMVSRLPLQLSEALSTNLLPNMSRQSALGDWQGIKYYLIRSYQLFLPISLVAIVGFYLIGPFIIQIIYPEFSYNRLGMTTLVVSTSVLMFVAPLNQFLLARKRVAYVVDGWMIGGVVLTLFVVFMQGNILTRLEIGYLAGALSIWACLGVFTYQALNQMKANNKELSQEASL